jgi:hypothetical protein
MITVLIVVMLVVSIAISKTKPRLAGMIDLGVALVILFGEVLPGTAGTLDWIFMFLFFVGGAVFCFAPKAMLPQKS